MNPETLDLPSLKEVGPTVLDLLVTYGLRIVGALGILVAVWLGSAFVARAVGSLLKRTRADDTLVSFAQSFVRWSLVLLGVLLCMGVFGIETTSIAAVIGGAGVGIGVALKGNLSNLASGLVLLAFRPFETGDWVKVSDREGRVAKVGLLHTEIDSFDNARHWIPNAEVIEDPLTNYDHHVWRRADLEVGVSYDSDLERVMEVLRGVVESMSAEEAPRGPVVLALGFGASSIDFKVGAWCRRDDLFAHRTQLLLAIKAAFDEAGISIPFPQRDLHIVGPVPSLAVVRDEAHAAK